MLVISAENWGPVPEKGARFVVPSGLRDVIQATGRGTIVSTIKA